MRGRGCGGVTVTPAEMKSRAEVKGQECNLPSAITSYGAAVGMVFRCSSRGGLGVGETRTPDLGAGCSRVSSVHCLGCADRGLQRWRVQELCPPVGPGRPPSPVIQADCSSPHPAMQTPDHPPSVWVPG